MAHSWWEIRVLCDPALEDIIFWRLEMFGCQGSVTQMKSNSCLMSAYLQEEKAGLLDLAALSLWLRQDALCAGLPLPAMQLDLIDEHRIKVNPVILGNGNPLFKRAENKLNLNLVRTRIFGNGNVLLCYQPDRK